MSKKWQAAILGYILLSVLVLAVCPLLPAKAQTSDSNSNLIFHDDFDGASVDASKWSVTQNVNGGQGGTINVGNSYLTLSSQGTSFPMICTANNPFQNTTDWTLEFDITYNSIGMLGSGFIVSKGTYFPYDHANLTTFLQIWSYGQSSVDFYFMGFTRDLSDRASVVSTVPYTQTFLVKLISENGTYSLFVNGALLSSQKSELQPDRIIIGHPEAIIIPFPDDAPWCSFKMDSISLYDNSPPTPQPNSTSTVPATTDSGETVNLAINGNITSQQISNATITTNQTTDTTTVSFTVTGENGTEGFANITIPLSAVLNGTIPAIYIDGTLAENQGYTQDSENFYVWFTTQITTNQILVTFANSPSNTGLNSLQITLYGVVIAAAILTVVAILSINSIKKGKTKEG
jgi:hypothetical protein